MDTKEAMIASKKLSDDSAKNGYRMKMQDGLMRSAMNRSEAEPVTTSKRGKRKRKRLKPAPVKTAMPKDGYPAICIDGPMKGMQTRVKDPTANVVAPMSSNPFYYAAIYKVTHQITPLGEIACAFSHLLNRLDK